MLNASGITINLNVASSDANFAGYQVCQCGSVGCGACQAAGGGWAPAAAMDNFFFPLDLNQDSNNCM